MLLLIMLLASLSDQGRAAAKPWELDYYRDRVVAGAKCRYQDGSRAVLLRTRSSRTLAFLLQDDVQGGTLIPLRRDSSGRIHFETNGGVATYHSVELALDYMLALPPMQVTPTTLGDFLNQRDVAACGRKTFDADLYETR